MQESGVEQPKLYRHTRTFLKIRSTPTDAEANAQKKRVDARKREHRVSHPSYSKWEQKPHSQEFLR